MQKIQMVAAPSGAHHCCKQRRLLAVHAALCLHFLNGTHFHVLLRFYLIVFSKLQTVMFFFFFLSLSFVFFFFFVVRIILTPHNGSFSFAFSSFVPSLFVNHIYGSTLFVMQQFIT